jgi:hypothetical protein
MKMKSVELQTTSWICDSCGEIIDRIEDGWVEWIHYVDRRKIGRGLRLVHHQPASPRKDGCQYDTAHLHDKEGLSDDGLESFVGPDGLMRLLSKLAEGSLPQESVIDMIQRIHIPGYEAARRHFQTAIGEDVIEPNLPKGFYWQSQIAAVIKWAEKQEA